MQHLLAAHPWFLRRLKTDFLKLTASALILASSAASAAQKWRMQYFYDEDKSSLAFTDIQCPSATHCAATAIVTDGKREKGVVAITGNGGVDWRLQDVAEHPISLFFLNESKGWMVTDRGIWETQEAGSDWKKLKDEKELQRVYFVDENRGWAIGAHKLVLETADGGHKWTPLAAAQQAPTAAEDTVYHWIAFGGKEQRDGLIVGTWSLHKADEVPDWMLRPDQALKRKPSPSLTILLQTIDGGKKWSETSRSLEGDMTRFRYGPAGSGFALFEFPNSAQLPSELFEMDLVAHKNTAIYQDPSRVVRDFVRLPGGDMILAGVERQGKSNMLPIAGKLKMMISSSLKSWIDMEVDYRAEANRAMIAAADDHNVWVATDTGMILKLTP